MFSARTDLFLVVSLLPLLLGLALLRLLLAKAIRPLFSGYL
jgi:hypothetical protein